MSLTKPRIKVRSIIDRSGKRRWEVYELSLIHISEPTRREWLSRMPSSA